MAQEFKQFYMEWLDWIVGAAINASTDYDSIDSRGFALITMAFSMDSTSAPDGQLIIEWSYNDVDWFVFDFTGEQFNVGGAGSGDLTVTEALGQVDVAALSGDAIFALTIKSPPQYMRGRWVSDSGGIATGMAASTFGRMAG